MKKHKKLVLFASIAVLATSGFKIRENKDSRKLFNTQLESYDDHFKKDNFEIIAHRGFSSKEVENSKEAICEAANKKYIDGIELDVRMTKDNKLVITHPKYVTTDNLESVDISNTNLSTLVKTPLYHISNSPIYQIKNLFNSEDGDIIITRKNELENKKYNLITLKEALKLCDNKKILLDLKFEDNFDSFSDELRKELKNTKLKNITFQSLDLASLLKFKKKNPTYKCQALVDKKEQLKYYLYFDQIGIKKNLVSNPEVKEIIKKNKKVSLWTISSVKDLDMVTEELGIYSKTVSYITDYPDIVGMYLEDKFPSQRKIKTKKKR